MNETKKKTVSANDLEVADIVEKARAQKQELSRAGAQQRRCRLDSQEQQMRQMQLLKAGKRKMLGGVALALASAGLIAGGWAAGLVAPVIAIPWAGAYCITAAVRFDRFHQKYDT